jgi:hypothetical protein
MIFPARKILSPENSVEPELRRRHRRHGSLEEALGGCINFLQRCPSSRNRAGR